MNNGLNYLLLVLVLFQLKHFLADYPLQGKYMLGKFKPGWDFFKPLLAHSLVHACMTSLIVLWSTGEARYAALCGLFDMFVHFTMDRIKAGPKYLGRFKDMYDKKFWWSLGLDQMVHHLTHYAILYHMIWRIQ